MAQRQSRRRRAVALRYEPKTYSAPQVVAQGTGDIADRIIGLARDNNVPIHEDGDLVALLAQLDIGTIIPPELYAAVAEVLAFVYRLKQSAENKGLGETR